MSGSGFNFSKRSLEKLNGVHPDLIKVMKVAIKLSPVDFGITEGLRDYDRQQQLYRSGLSKTLNSRHLTGHAVDVVAYNGSEVTWENEYYEKIAGAVKEAAACLGVEIEWGGDWKNFKDLPHFQLSWGRHPLEI